MMSKRYLSRLVVRNVLAGIGARTVVAETLYIDDEIQSLIEQRKINEISLRLKEQKDYLTIQKDARRLVSESVFSLEEAVRILG